MRRLVWMLLLVTGLAAASLPIAAQAKALHASRVAAKEKQELIAVIATLRGDIVEK